MDTYKCVSLYKSNTECSPDLCIIQNSYTTMACISYLDFLQLAEYRSYLCIIQYDVTQVSHSENYLNQPSCSLLV